AEQRGLAGAVRPDDAERLAFGEREIESARDHHGAEALGDFFEGEDGRHATSKSVQHVRRAPSPRRREGEDHDKSCSCPPTGISGAVLLVVMTRSKRSSLRCHCPATSGVLVTFLTG